MKPVNFYPFVSARKHRRALATAFILLGGIIAAPRTFAQDSAPGPAVPSEVDPPMLAVEKPIPAPVDDVALNGPPETYALPPAPAVGGKEVTGGATSITSAPKHFQWGVRLTVRGVYDDNIFLSHFDRQSDWYVAIEPAITIGYGNIVERQGSYIRLDYAPSIFVYIDHDDSTAAQHLIRLEGGTGFGRLLLGLSQDVQLLNGGHLDRSGLDASAISLAGSINAATSGTTDAQLYATNFGWSYDLSDKTFLSGAAYYRRQDFNTLVSSDEFGGNLFFNYKYSPRLAFGIGGSGGFATHDIGPDETFEQGLLRVQYQATGKISVNASAGVEVRQFDNSSNDGSRSDRVSGVYEIGATYQPFDGTMITLRGSSRVLGSAIVANSDYLATNILLGVRQRLLQRVYLGFTAGYEHADYFNTVPGIDGAATRNDDYFLIEPAVDVMVTRWFTVGAYYLYRTNDSPIARFDYYENQFGMRASFTY
jgi:Putative beta-barrel porin 2